MVSVTSPLVRKKVKRRHSEYAHAALSLPLVLGGPRTEPFGCFPGQKQGTTEISVAIDYCMINPIKVC